MAASLFSFGIGLQPYLDYVWINCFDRFAEARANLRKAAFNKPYGHLASKLILEEPFSMSLFDDKTKNSVSDFLSSQGKEWGDIINLTQSARAEFLKRKHDLINALTRYQGMPSRPSYNARRGSSFRRPHRGRGHHGQPAHVRSRPGRGGQKFRSSGRSNRRSNRRGKN